MYRSGWLPSDAVSTEPLGLERDAWEAMWTPGRVPLRNIAECLAWPDEVLGVLDLVVPMMRRLWVDIDEGEEALDLERRTVPWLRRTACLLHGFVLGHCSVRGVWEAVSLGGRTAVAVVPER